MLQGNKNDYDNDTYMRAEVKWVSLFVAAYQKFFSAT